MDVNHRGMWDNTPLMSACQYRHPELAMYLISAGADVNAVNERGNTALLHAALEGTTTVSFNKHCGWCTIPAFY